jgi:glutamate formiminotransferase
VARAELARKISIPFKSPRGEHDTSPGGDLSPYLVVVDHHTNNCVAVHQQLGRA